MATTKQTTTVTKLVPVTTTEESTRVILNLKAPASMTDGDVRRFNNELIRLAKSRGFTPMKKKAPAVQDQQQAA
jgi:hypothetical protein